MAFLKPILRTSENIRKGGSILSFYDVYVFIDILNPTVYTKWKSVREKADEKFRYAIKNTPVDIINFIRENRELIDE